MTTSSVGAGKGTAWAVHIYASMLFNYFVCYVILQISVKNGRGLILAIVVVVCAYL